MTLISQTDDEAIVNAELSYEKYDNKPPVKDQKSRIHLIWSVQNNSWLFDYKDKP